MAPRWQPGEEYNYGDVVEYEEVDYKIIQPHRSQGDWTPPVTPALWGRMQGGGHGQRPHHQSSGQWGEDCNPSRHPSGYGQQPQHQHHQRQEADQPSYSTPAVQPTKEEAEKHWYDIDDKRKKELEVGGGLLAGIAAIGAGYYAYKEHGKNEEEKKAQQWSLNNWIVESQARTQQWRSGGYNAPVAWIWNEGKSIPRDAIQGGEERGEQLYICRAYHESGLMVGKACKVFKKGGVIGYKKDEIHLDKYEILVGNSQAVRWVPCSGQLNIQGLRATPVEGGREPDGTPQYIAQAPYNGAVHPGKACETFGDGCFIPYDDTEKKVKEYAVLCYA
ncbi:carbohydrate-binding module family 12 protein [Gyrodon lividus]|nr:carbohydrate-binding module family 12 protein [Gyrodon lividus]